MLEKLQAVASRYEELCAKAEQPDFYADPARAAKLLKECVLNRTFCYDENRLLEINFQNARCTEDTNLNKYVNKRKSKGKVDMVVAAINALYLLQEEMNFGRGMDWGIQVV